MFKRLKMFCWSLFTVPSWGTTLHPPEVVPEPAADRDGGAYVHGGRAGGSPDQADVGNNANDPPGDPEDCAPQPGGFNDIAAQAAARIVSPITQQFEYVAYKPVPPGGTIMARAEVAAESQDGTIAVASCQTLVVTASGALVDPLQLQSKCGHPGCDQFESAMLRCITCGAARCYLHAKQITIGGQERIYCDEHAQEAIRSFNTWAEHDLTNGIAPQAAQKPPSPVAPKAPQPRIHYHEPPQKHPRSIEESPRTRGADEGHWGPGR